MRKPIRILLEATGLRLLYKLLKKGGEQTRRAVARRLQPLSISSEKLGPPKGTIHLSTYIQRHQLAYKEVWPEETREEPLQRFRPTGATFQKAITDQLVPRTLSSSHAVVLPGARVFGPNGLVITADDRVITETLGSYWGTPEPHPIFSCIKLPRITQVAGTVAMIGANYAHGYYHWMLEILPRFEILKRAGFPFDKIYMSPLLTRFQKETLAALKFSEEQAIWSHKQTHLKTEQLVLPSLPGLPGQIPLWVCDYLRQLFLPQEPVAQQHFLVVSRRKAARRRILNETQLFQGLQPLGFKEVVLEDHSVTEQARLFASARAIVATHGAALTNLVFCSPGTLVIELYTPTRNYHNFQILSHLMNLPYHGLLMSLKGLSRTAEKKQDLLVDVPGLVSYLETVMT